jgi:hypothetical protein
VVAGHGTPSGTRPARSAIGSCAAHAAIAAGYLALAVAHTYPLIEHLDSRLPGQGLGDNVSFVWNLWWMRQALASPAYQFFASPLILAPLGGSLVLHTHTALTAFVAATLLAPLPVVEAQNVLLIASIALNGFAAYVLAYAVTRARTASLAAGALFLVAPAIAARLMGHYNLVLAWPMVFACAALVAWWRRPCLPVGLALAITTAAIPYADYYYAIFFGLFALLYSATEFCELRVSARRPARQTAGLLLLLMAGAAFLVAALIAFSPYPEITIAGARVSMRSPTNALMIGWLLTAAAALATWRPSLRVSRRQRATPSPRLAHQALLLGIVLVLVVPVAVPAWHLWQSGDYVTQRSSLKSSPRGVDAASMVLGPPFSGPAGAAVRQTYRRFGIDPIESSAWIGLFTIFLVAVAARVRSREREFRRWSIVGAAFGLWSLGPYLIVLGSNTGLLLPQALARLVPVLNNARIPGRAMTMVALAAAILAAMALIRPVAKPARRSWLWLLAALAVLENIAAPLPLATMPDAGVYRQIALDATARSVLTLPFGVRDGFGEQGRGESESLYAQTLHGHPLIGGFLARVSGRTWAWYESTEPYRTLLALSSGAAAATAPPGCDVIASGLQQANVGFVVLYRDDAPAPLTAFATARLPLRMVAADDRRTLFAVDPEASPCNSAE